MIYYALDYVYMIINCWEEKCDVWIVWM